MPPQAPKALALNATEPAQKEGSQESDPSSRSPSGSGDSSPNELARVRCALRYLSNRLDQIDYHCALANDLPIGSSLIEAGHRHVLHTRLKWANRLARSKSHMTTHHS